MSEHEITHEELVAYLAEQLPSDRMSFIEEQLRTSDSLRERLGGIAANRDVAVHSVGEVWRRERLSCPTRSELGSFLLGALSAEQEDYIDFHLKTVGCRYCEANLWDLEKSREPGEETTSRRRKFYQTSAGKLPQADDERKS